MKIDTAVKRWIRFGMFVGIVISFYVVVKTRQLVDQISHLDGSHRVPPPAPNVATPVSVMPAFQYSDRPDVYRPASPETRQIVEGRWQIMEDWIDGACFYSWNRQIQEQSFEKRSLVIGLYEMTESHQHPWEDEEHSAQGKTIDMQPPFQEHLCPKKRITVFDVQGPMTFYSVIALSYGPSGYEPAEKFLFPDGIKKGGVDRGIADFHDGTLDLYWADATKDGIEREFPKAVVYPPRGVGISLLRLRRYPDDFSYPPEGIDVDQLRLRHEAKAKRTLPIGPPSEFRSLNAMPPELRAVFERSREELKP